MYVGCPVTSVTFLNSSGDILVVSVGFSAMVTLLVC